MSRKRRVERVEPERKGLATWRQGDQRPVLLELRVDDACELVMLLEVAAGVYEQLPPRSQFDVHTSLTARGVRKTVERVRECVLAAVADVVDPGGAVQDELVEAGS